MRGDEARAPTNARALPDDSGTPDERPKSLVRIAELGAIERTPGGTSRIVLSRRQAAACAECDEAWTDNLALIRGTEHAKRDGHIVRGWYSAEFLYASGGGS